jgi:tetratricopeptide (TPR) repeat protein
MLPSRTLLPIGLAVLCAAALLGFLWWQIVSSGAVLLRAENGNDALSNTTTVIAQENIDPRDQALLKLREGDLFALQGEWMEAKAAYEGAVDAGGGLAALRKLAQAQMQVRDVRSARLTVEQMKRAGAREEDLLLLESIIMLRTGELQKTRQILSTALDSPQKHYASALLAIVEGNHEAAQTELKDVEAGWEPVLRTYARSLQAAYDEYALFPESPDIHLVTLLARALAQVQECELALPLLGQVTTKQADYRDAWIIQGFCELTTQRTDQAMLSLERAYALDPEKPEIQYFLARAYAAQGNHQNALTFFQYALRNGFEPQKDVRQLIAREAMQLGDADAALEQQQALVSMSDADIASYDAYVTMAIVLGKHEEAYVKGHEAVEKWPKDAKAYDLLGQAALATGRTDEAKQAWQRALEINPALATAKEGLKKL